MSTTKPLVLVVGATGYTGKSVVDGLVASGNFRVSALIRPASLSKPSTDALRAAGVEIRTGDVTDAQEKLTQVLAGVDILISCVHWLVLDAQRTLFQAAKKAGVKRVVPCDWATPGAAGIRQLHDTKLAIHEFVEKLGVGYTFIDVGWWMQLYLPLPTRAAAALPQMIRDMSWTVYGAGDAPNLLTHLPRIGTYVARIIADDRTLNRAVIVWDDEVTQAAAHEIGERVSGEGEALKAKRINMSEDMLAAMRRAAIEAFGKDPQNMEAMMQTAVTGYSYSMYVLKENTLENAKKLGYLDVRELYPDLPRQTLEEYAKEFYALEDPGTLVLREEFREMLEGGK